jgi:TRAP-type mannitol/chloroaromatic compound transport system permease small subunit
MKSWLRVAAAIDGLNDRIGSAVSWLAVVMVLLGTFNAVARYSGRFFGLRLSSNAYIELQWYLFSLIFLLGAAWCLRRDAHVRVDVLYGRFGRRAQAWIDLAGTILFLVPFCVFMLWVSWPSVRNAWVIREVSPDPGGLPRYPLKALILVCFALLLLQAAAQLIRTVHRIRHPAAAADDDERRPAVEAV